MNQMEAFKKASGFLRLKKTQQRLNSQLEVLNNENLNNMSTRLKFNSVLVLIISIFSFLMVINQYSYFSMIVLAVSFIVSLFIKKKVELKFAKIEDEYLKIKVRDCDKKVNVELQEIVHNPELILIIKEHDIEVYDKIMKYIKEKNLEDLFDSEDFEKPLKEFLKVCKTEVKRNKKETKEEKYNVFDFDNVDIINE